MPAYYNEHDPYPAQWLRNLIAAGHIAPGDVDERDIRTVSPSDLVGFSQCHFFAGIGGWSYALRLAGVPDDWPCWTGSCPCQPLSSAGQRKGHADERHLWPAFYSLIAECSPAIVFGEQVDGADGREWLSGVRADLEASGYAVGAANLPACGIGAPHERRRLYFVADAKRRQHGHPLSRRQPCDEEMGGSLADGHQARQARGPLESRLRASEISLDRCAVLEAWQGWNGGFGGFGRVDDGIPKIVAGVFVGAFGNAIVPNLAAEFISAFLECQP